jgi:hypothetical protein
MIPGFLIFDFGMLAQSASPTPVEIKDIAPPIDVFPYPAWLVTLVVAGILILIALAVWLFVRWIRNRPQPPPPTPSAIALAELNGIRELIDRIDPYTFSIRVSDILRAYVSAQFQLHAEHQTSPEFLAAISDSPKFQGQEKELLALFLEKCDLIKFARIDATATDSTTLLEQAFRFVDGGAA